MDQDISGLGFKCGVEIHQQILTSQKLFCHCPAGRYSDDHDAEVLRHMRPTLSEMGVYDGCALMEFKTKKEILYLLKKETVCTYEMDDTPPFPINEEALDIAIELALLCGCQIVDELHIARKQYLDGSIPTGFQRTGIIGINGHIPFEGKLIEVMHFSIEEDACREVFDRGHTIGFRTDRLGMPLIEVVTAPCFKSPEEAARGVRHIGRLLRASKHVRTGIGAVRQDVNVSIEGGSRVEIKGVPRYQLIPALTRNEALRQKALLDIRKELKGRGTDPGAMLTADRDITDELRETSLDTLSSAIGRGHRIRGIRLSGATGILNHPTQPGRTLASELSGRVRVIACLDELPNLFHTDDRPCSAVTDMDKVKDLLEIRRGDVGIVVWGPKADTITAADEIKNRMIEAFEGVPEETRQRLAGGITDFERILPGADRMYPDTDHPPAKIERRRVEGIRTSLPEPTYSVESRLREYGLPEDTLPNIALSRFTRTIERCARSKLDMNAAGHLVGRVFRSLERRGCDLSSIDDERLYSLVSSLCRSRTPQKFFRDIVIEVLGNQGCDIDTVVSKFEPSGPSRTFLRKAQAR